MSPIFLGAANSTNKVVLEHYGSSPSSAIESDAQAANWNDNTGGNGLAWVKISGFNNNNEFLVYSKFANNKLYCMAARWCGSDNTQSNSGNTGKIRWEATKDPNQSGSGNQNDWGSGTHTFNAEVDYSIPGNETANNLSARTILWNKNRSSTLWTFHGVDQTSDLLFNMAVDESWSVCMQSRGPSSGTDYFQNTAATVVAGQRVDNGLVSGFDSTVDSSWSQIRIGITDGESVTAGSNDVFMIFFDDSNDFGNTNGVGWKRSNVTGNWGSSMTFDTSNDNNAANSNYYGVIAENSDNGSMRNRANGIICCLVNAF